jgi:hypothetical protein
VGAGAARAACQPPHVGAERRNQARPPLRGCALHAARKKPRRANERRPSQPWPLRVVAGAQAEESCWRLMSGAATHTPPPAAPRASSTHLGRAPSGRPVPARRATSSQSASEKFCPCRRRRRAGPAHPADPSGDPAVAHAAPRAAAEALGAFALFVSVPTRLRAQLASHSMDWTPRTASLRLECFDRSAVYEKPPQRTMLKI